MENERAERARAAEQRRPLAMLGGRGDERPALRGHGAPLRDPARVSGVGALALGAHARQTRVAARHKGRGARAARGRDAHGVLTRRCLEAIQADLDRSPFQGAGPSEDPRACGSMPTGSGSRGRRCCGSMRSQAALPAPRPPAGTARVHAATVSQAPVMSHRRRAEVFTPDDGRGWIFTAVEHWNAQCVGWHVCKDWEPVCGAASRSAIRGSGASMAPSTPTALEGWRRCGWTIGSQYLVRPLFKLIRYWAIRPSYGFVEGTGNERRGGAVESHAQGASDPRAHLPVSQGCVRAAP